MVGRAVNSGCAITVYTPEPEYWAAGLRLLLFPWLPTSAPPEFPKQRARGARGEEKKNRGGGRERDSLANPRPPALYNPRVCAAEDPRAAPLSAAASAAPHSAPLLPKGRASPRLGGKREGRDPEPQYKRSFSGVFFLTRCSNSSERQRERAGGLEEPSVQSRAPGDLGRQLRSERSFASEPAAPSLQPSG